LALCRQKMSASGATGAKFDVGPFEGEWLRLFDVDVEGRRHHGEWFTTDRLGDAIVRLYERYAERLPDGPERVRAAATAHSVAAGVEPKDYPRWPEALAPAVEFVDHRPLGFPAVRGAKQFMDTIRSLHEVATDVETRLDDLVCVQSNGLIIRRTQLG